MSNKSAFFAYDPAEGKERLYAYRQNNPPDNSAPMDEEDSEDLGSEDSWSNEEDIESYGDDGDSFVEKDMECEDSDADFEMDSSDEETESMEEEDDCSSEHEYSVEGPKAFIYK